MSELKKLVTQVLSEDTNLGIVGIQGIVQKDYTTTQDTDQLEEKNLDNFCVEVDGKIVWEGQAKDKKEALSKAEDENGDEFEGKVSVYKKAKVEESEEDIKLSPESFKTLYTMFIAEQMINESVGEDPDLSKHGLTNNKKLTVKGRAILKKYLPTLFAS